MQNIPQCRTGNHQSGSVGNHSLESPDSKKKLVDGNMGWERNRYSAYNATVLMVVEEEGQDVCFLQRSFLYIK